jgi:thymidylate kinase
MKERFPEKPPIIAFEGISRAGKGTQIDQLKSTLCEVGLNFVELRGDGTREGLGNHDGDPFSPWWQEYSKKLRDEGTTDEWNYAAYVLAREINGWRQSAYELNKQVVLLDRSILSRASFVIDRVTPLADILLLDDLYPIQPGPKLAIEDILPDIIFELVAPKHVVLSRLDPNDPKLAFRTKLIEQNYETFYGLKERLPDFVQERIVTVDSSQPRDIVFDNILETLDAKLEAWKKLYYPGS